MLIAKGNIKYDGKLIMRGSKIVKGQIKAETLKTLIADGIIEDISETKPEETKPEEEKDK